ncbi:MAG: hypothetical protein U0V75_16725 [Ferruginibacter sp.]
MKNGLSRFENYLLQLQSLLTKAAKQKNPAGWLYRNNARTPLFMLEGLAKLYGGIHNKKKFGKIKEQFKLLEDALGVIDYYDAFSKQFSANKKIPAAVTSYLQAQTREKIQRLNELLTEKNWIGDDADRIQKIRKKLESADWLKPAEDIKEIEAFYGEAIYTINAFAVESKFHFDNVEADVHELRRRLRWLSIYPQALQGCIQLSANKKKPSKQLSKYLTKSVITSPFNKMPDAGNNTHFLLLDQQYFFALSWMIAELGRLKDSGLSVIAVKEALQQTSQLNDEQAYQKAYQLLGKQQLTIPKLLQQADAVCKVFFAEHNLEYLVKGRAAAN